MYLELLLLDLETADHLLHLVRGASAVAQLVGEVLDLLAEVLVLATKSLELERVFCFAEIKI